MSWANSEPLSPGEAIERLQASTATVVVIGLPTSRNASHLRASPDAPGRVADALMRNEGNPHTETGVDLAADGALQVIGMLALETEDEFDRIHRVASAAFRLRAPLHWRRPLGDVSGAGGPARRTRCAGHRAPDAHPDLYDSLQGNPLPRQPLRAHHGARPCLGAVAIRHPHAPCTSARRCSASACIATRCATSPSGQRQP
jgi:hypothetical protein